MKRIIFLLMIVIFAAVILAFGTDYLMFRYRVFRSSAPFGSVTIHEYYAINEKNRRTEYVYKSTEQETCVHSLFGHSGYLPCWYARRHTERAVAI
jgi:hypothetical protein